jgi:hypothetical protein
MWWRRLVINIENIVRQYPQAGQYPQTDQYPQAGQYGQALGRVILGFLVVLAGIIFTERAFATMGDDSFPDRSGAGGSFKQQLSGNWAWWSEVRSQDSPFGVYDYQRKRLFKLVLPQADISEVKVIGAAAQVTELILRAHRLVGSATVQTVILEPLERDGQWYLWFTADKNSFAEIKTLVLVGSQEILAQTQVNVYPPYLAAHFPAKVTASLPSKETVPLDRPHFMVSQRGLQTSYFMAKVPLKLSVNPPQRGRLWEFTQGSLRKIAEGLLTDIDYAPPENPQTASLGYDRTSASVILAELADGTRLSLNMEVFRNNRLYSQKPKAVILLAGTVLLTGLGVFGHRKIGGRKYGS